MGENREYKSDVFSMLMENPANALAVYNALNGTDYQNPEQVTIKKLEKGISLTVRNDAAFVINCNINIYEHQSTYNPNMPLRSLIYFTDIIRPAVKDRDVYSRKLRTKCAKHASRTAAFVRILAGDRKVACP
jgi:hypothetical protein